LKPLVSVIIPCYNYAEYLGDAIESILVQTYPNVEIIVVNDGSTDNTSEVARKYGVQLIEQENKGLSGARNSGIRNAKGEWISCLDADDKLHPDYLTRCLEENADIISTGTQEFGERHNKGIPSQEPIYQEFVLANRIHCASLYRKEVWEKTGGYDETIEGYEDWEYWLRAAKLGFKIKTVQEYLFFYRKHGPSLVDKYNAMGDKLYKDLLRRNNIAMEEKDGWTVFRPIYLSPEGKAAVIQEHAAKNGHRTFIETGTHHGCTIGRVKDHFEEIYSIEIGESLHRECAEKYRYDPHIKVFLGNSATVLPELLKTIDKPCIFWLDAHHSAGDTCGAEVDIPIWDEIKAIREHRVKDHIMLIDDMRGFSEKELTDYILSFGPAQIENKDDILRVFL